MRVLLDANLPRGLARLLAGHEVRSAHAHGWSDLDDGPLLDAAAAAGYEALLGLGFQHRAYGYFLVAAVSSAAFWLLEAAGRDARVA